MKVRLTRDFAAIATAQFNGGVQQVCEVPPGLGFPKYAHVDHCCFSSGWNDRLTGYRKRKGVGKRKEHKRNIEEGANQTPPAIRAEIGRFGADSDLRGAIFGLISAQGDRGSAIAGSRTS